MTWSGRSELAMCLQQNRSVFSLPDRELIVVHTREETRRLTQILSQTKGIRGYAVAVSSPFSKSRFLNLGVWACRTDTIFLVDADIILPEETISDAHRALGPGRFVSVDRGKELSPDKHPQVLRGANGFIERRQITELVFRNGRIARTEFWQDLHGRSISGLIMMRKSDYIGAGGSNSNLEGWGFEDLDLQIRLQVQCKLEKMSVGTATHITHEMKSVQVMKQSEAVNIALCFDNYEKGDFLGTYVEDTRDYQSQVVIWNIPS
jgi:hypothetical protein